VKIFNGIRKVSINQECVENQLLEKLAIQVNLELFVESSTLIKVLPAVRSPPSTSQPVNQLTCQPFNQ